MRKTYRYLLLFIIVLAAGLFLVGCGALTLNGNNDTGTDSGTPVPTPTRDPSGFQAVPPQACIAADWGTLQNNQPAGDLIAWQPENHNLAYMAPSERTSWYLGLLMLAKGPDYQERINLAPATLAAGDLTWSPSGATLAFVAYRVNENVYTVMTVHPDGSGLKDLFPNDAARTDSRSSDKSILGWKDESTLQVISSCGEECKQSYDIRIDGQAGAELTPTSLADYHQLDNNLQIHQRVLLTETPDPQSKLPSPTPELFPKGMRSFNWSPDDSLIDALDKRGLLWLLKREDKTMYMLDIGLRDVYETQWSSDSQALAIRVEDRIFVFDIPCTH